MQTHIALAPGKIECGFAFHMITIIHPKPNEATKARLQETRQILEFRFTSVEITFRIPETGNLSI